MVADITRYHLRQAGYRKVFGHLVSVSGHNSTRPEVISFLTVGSVQPVVPQSFVGIAPPSATEHQIVAGSG